MLPDSLSHILTRLGVKAEVPDAGFRVLRHTHLTWLLQLGVSLKVVQERAGHSKSTTALDNYAHVSPGMQEEAAAKFEERFAMLVTRR